MKGAKKSGKVTPAFIIHHKDYVTDLNFEDDEVFFNINNLESLCQECHNKEHFKTQDYKFDENGDLVRGSIHIS